MLDEIDRSKLDIDPLELPLQDPPDTPFWAENYILEINCPNEQFSFLMHLGRQTFDKDLWREILIARSGGDDVYAYRGFGRGAHAQGPGGAQLKFVCEESFKRWTAVFEGAGQRLSAKDLSPSADGSPPEGTLVQLKIRVELTAEAPIWDNHSAVQVHAMGDMHYEQNMRVTGGEILVDGVRTDLTDGVVMRDHTRGPRNFSGLGSYSFIHGGFKGGRYFIVLTLEERKGQPGHTRHATAVLWDGAQFHEVQILEDGSVPDPKSYPPSEYVIRLQGPDGEEIIKGRHQYSPIVISLAEPNNFILGPSKNESVRGHLCGAPTEFEWNGEKCYGYSEQLPEI